MIDLAEGARAPETLRVHDLAEPLDRIADATDDAAVLGLLLHHSGWHSADVARAPKVGVIGAGIVGLSTAYALLEWGADVRVYESGVPGNGQSGGDSRIRYVHDDPRLVEFTRKSRGIWDEWAERLGIELVSRDGVVALGGAGEGRLRLLEQVGGMRARAMDAAELGELLPPLAEYSGPTMLDQAGGAIRARGDRRAGA